MSPNQIAVLNNLVRQPVWHAHSGSTVQKALVAHYLRVTMT